MLGKIPAARVALIDAIIQAAQRLRRFKKSGVERDYLRNYFRGVSEHDLRAHTRESLAAAALKHLNLGRTRRRGQTLIQLDDGIERPEGSPYRATVAIVTDDMPFLVDSLGIVLNQLNIAVHLIVHPVMDVRRGKSGRLLAIGAAGPDAMVESWQLIEIDRPRDDVAAAELVRRIRSTLADVHAAVKDFDALREQTLRVARELDASALPVARSDVAEARALLTWMEERHFVFLGYRYYRLRRGAKSDTLVRDRESGLGILRPSRVRNRKRDSKVLTNTLRDRAREKSLLVLTKANSISTVHRASYLDYVGVKTFDSRGRANGEHRFLGLWTSSAYHMSPRDIPLLRHKVQTIIAHFGLPAHSHDAKALANAIETYPRDELFQADTSDLIRILRGIVNLYERHQVRLFVRRDAYERFYSCLVFAPRDRYNTQVRERIEAIMRARFAGTHIESQVQISESALARLHLLVRTKPGASPVRDIAAIEQEIAAAATTWSDRLRAALLRDADESRGLELAQRYASAFSPAYQDDIEPAHALEDIEDLEALAVDAGRLRLNLYFPDLKQRAKNGRLLNLKIIKSGSSIPISDVLPMLENFGLRVLAEHPYEVLLQDGELASVQDLELEMHDASDVDLERLEPMFKTAFRATWNGDSENDGFNRLLLAAGLELREVVVLRAYCRYLLQTGLPFSQLLMERVLANHATITRQLAQLFQVRFQLDIGAKTRDKEMARLDRAIVKALTGVRSADDDRILRAYLRAIRATLRTNFHQTLADGGLKSWLSLKFDPQRLPDLPLPRPKFEIFVYSPRVEGVHLRMGFVARGGIRWSDRREDFRTEVLGLMKAQNVKNTLIVPVGAKGGFFPKRLPHGGSRDDVQREVIASYRTFIRGLLDVTDNIVGGKVVPRDCLVRHDGDDAYLVVAADKGTATFSDIANAISIEYGHWLGDAFASGGSAGYDHKKMGITARGAWECVKRHFRELGVDTQGQEFTVAGIGDMSGDVFGNGMLLSRHIRLQAAFNHLHIFIDPDPDAAVSFRERQRLFDLPRSSWSDYDRKLISKGGGVYERSAKTIALTAEARTLLGIETAAPTPTEVIRAIIRMPVDLLWNGGIGTYVKATDESNAEVGDRTNDAIRANGKELRARIVGEGGNLGCTQRGRIEYALAGGRINTDFIDNSAGVNTSDVEVNLKILFSQVESAGRLKRTARDALLKRMTTAVAELVLRNNYLQSQAISTLELHSAERLIEYQSLIRSLERAGDLNRSIEYLPTEDEFLDRRKRKLGLTRPELAIALSYSKIWLSNQLIESDLPEDPYFITELERYFPEPVRTKFPRDISRHPLRREIVTTATTNSIVNRMGPVFVLRAQEDTDADPARIARAYTIAREAFAMRDLWAGIEALDTRVPARVQYAMMYEASRLLRHTSYWLLRERRRPLAVDVAVRDLRVGVADLADSLEEALGTEERSRLAARAEALTGEGVPSAIAIQVARLPWLEPSLDIVALASNQQVGVREAALVYFGIGAEIGLDWLHERIDHLSVDGQWQAVARAALRDNARRAHREIAARALKHGRQRGAQARIQAWSSSMGEELTSWKRTLVDMRASGGTDFATLSVGVEAIRSLTTT
ncbi:MAG TPA: NAD-glutamate dehydrogenase [Steroidobacteraceae bacterium]|nr:NAD-glutamate dehydrogenase [Steroidobacteraceae bacterium]